MVELSPFYEKKYICPICQMNFSSLAVRSSAVYTEKRESDLHIIYKGISPLHYSIIVCPVCSYAASSNLFAQELPRVLIQQLTTALSLLPTEQLSFNGERDLHTVQVSFQLAIRTSQLKKVGPGELAGLLLAAAWIARESGDHQLENTYLEESLKHYLQAFEKCSDHIGNLTDIQALYLIGDLYYRTGNYSEAINWFNRVIVHPKIKTNAAYEKMARDQWALAREEAKALSPNSTPNVKEDELVGDEKDSPDPEVPINQERNESKKPASVSRRHTTMQMMTNLYPDQIDWLSQVVNQGYNSSKSLIKKEQVLRTLIDVMVEKLDGQLPDNFSNEAELRLRILEIIK